jgi:hypothetical protein
MGTRNKLINTELIKTTFCDICGRDTKELKKCKICKKDFCNECSGTSSKYLCKNCDGLCKGCYKYTIEEIAKMGLNFCPNCGTPINRKK